MTVAMGRCLNAKHCTPDPEEWLVIVSDVLSDHSIVARPCKGGYSLMDLRLAGFSAEALEGRTYFLAGSQG